MSTTTIGLAVISKFLRKNNNFNFNRLNQNVRLFSAAVGDNFELIKLTKTGKKQNVGLIQMNRTKGNNAVKNASVIEIGRALKHLEADSSVGAIVITGSEKVFAAGAEIKEMVNMNFSDCFFENLTENWTTLASTRKPIIAAVNGFAVGGGCELALMCDIIYAGETAKFSQAEILLGVIPAVGATQRLPKTVGKSKAMEMILTGDQITAQEAERIGLVSKVFPVDKLVDETVKLAERIASNSRIANAIAKECVNTALETTLREGLRFEKRMFHACFATKDQKEGMSAFIEKREPNFTHE